MPFSDGAFRFTCTPIIPPKSRLMFLKEIYRHVGMVILVPSDPILHRPSLCCPTLPYMKSEVCNCLSPLLSSPLSLPHLSSFRAYWGLQAHFPSEAESLYSSLESSYQRTLQSCLRSSGSAASLPQSDRSSSSSQESLK